MNLFSARSIYIYVRYIGLFNDNNIYIIKEKVVKIYATLDGDLYIVNFIVDEYR
jgi:hypothetical protein